MTRYIYPLLFSLVIFTYAVTSAHLYGKQQGRAEIKAEYAELYTFVKQEAGFITQLQLIELEDQGV